MTDAKSIFHKLFKSTVNGRYIEASLSEIDCDESWNARTGDWKADLDELESSMLPQGPDGPIVQDIPVVVRPHPEQFSPKPYFLISGFSRCECIARIAKRREINDPKVSCLIRVVDEGEALAMNLRENQARNPLKPADAAKQLHKLYYWYGDNQGIWLQPDELGALVGTNALVANRMLEIMRKGSPDLIRLWQNSRIDISLLDLVMVVRKYSKPEQKRAFLFLTTRLSKTTCSSNGTGKAVSVERRAKQVGTLLGILETEGKITIHDKNFESYLDSTLGYTVRKGSFKRTVLARLMGEAYRIAISSESRDDSNESIDEIDEGI